MVTCRARVRRAKDMENPPLSLSPSPVLVGAALSLFEHLPDRSLPAVRLLPPPAGKPDDIGFLVHHSAIVVIWSMLLTQGFGHTFALVGGRVCVGLWHGPSGAAPAVVSSSCHSLFLSTLVCVFKVCMLCEATQPFLGFKWFGDQFKLRSHPLYIANGLTIFFGW